MQALQSYWPGKQLSPLFPIFPTQAAENLAWECLEAPSWTPPNPGVLSRAKFPDTWHMGSADGRVALILRQDRLIDDLVSAGNLNEPLAGITVRLLQPGRPGSDNEAFLETSASEHMPGWDLAVYLDQDPFAAAARQQNAAYLWIGSLGIATIAILAAIVARYVSRQMKLTRLKNDLIATVSHELKTPLASMRVLVDTLLEGRCRDQRQAQEYFRLIGKENERLSRLIDNFLTFSRMERNKKAFEFSPVNVNEIVTTAEDCIRDRFSGPDCRLDCDLEANLPAVSADRDAMVTVILNLLDNAWKYSGDKKHVRVRTYWADGKVCVAVSDNGTGMSRTVAKKIFNRFYQVDQTLSRKAGGCGLGLSIVKFIIDAHGGTIDVTTHPGEGSTFTVQLPVHSARG